jgi:hypothetical protein
MVRFSPEEHEHLLAQAKRANKGPARLIRALVAGSRLKSVALYPPEVYRAIVGLSRNFNQLVRKVHSTSALDREDTRTMFEELHKVYECLISRPTRHDSTPA